jgi:hypothetical protein
MTPAKAIRVLCKICKNGSQYKCTSENCKLNDKRLSTLKRIKAYCLTCNSAQSYKGVKDCDGKVLNPEPYICPLHPYRLGHNPKLKGKGRKMTSEEFKERVRSRRKEAFL